MGTIITTITVSMYVLGVVGMAGMWLIPARAWSLLVLRRVRHPLPHRPLGVLFAIVTFIPIAISLLVASWAIPRVFRCLSDMVCGPNRASGLLSLAVFGASVLLAEVVWQIAALLLARVREHAA
ncbi:MAG TPA: hypothetical protein VJX92_18505 [Methylomirabilota bacterium]|nr:hypothetical protein [Methylomirabilota bacterium]